MSKPNQHPALSTDYDIVIVGAGMVGAALACGIASTGVSILLLDQQLPPKFNPEAPPHIRVSALSAGSESLLSRLGVWQHIKTMRSCVYRRLAVWEHQPLSIFNAINKKPNQTLFNCKDVGQTHLGHVVENIVTQQALHQKIHDYPNVQLHYPANIEQIHFSDDKPEVALGSGEHITAKLVIGADGALSKVRQWAHIGQHTNQYQQEALVTTVCYEGDQEDITWQAFTPTGPRAFLPLPDVAGKHYASLVWYDQPRRVKALLRTSEADFIHELKTHFPEQLPPLISVIERASFPLVKRHADTYIRPHLALAGDAAHTINPLAGQGVNLGFQDVIALTDVLTAAIGAGEDIGDMQVLERYQVMRRKENQKMMSAMDLFYHMFSNNALPLKLLRNLGLGLANNFTAGKKQVLRYAMGIHKTS